MNYPPPGQPMAQNFRPMPNRRQSDYHYPPPTQFSPHQYTYANYPPGPQYPMPTQYHPYQPQWYQPYPHYVAPLPPRPFQPHSPMVVSSRPLAHQPPPRNQPTVQTPQPVSTPQPEQSTPSTVSQAVTSQSTTPTTTSVTTSTPPVSTPKPIHETSTVKQASPVTSNASIASSRVPFYPQLPWLSHPESEFPPRTTRRRRRRRPAQIPSDEVELPSRESVQAILASAEPVEQVTEVHVEDTSNLAEDESKTQPQQILEVEEVQPEVVKIDSETEDRATITEAPIPGHKRTATKPIVPAIPVLPTTKPQKKPAADASPPLQETTQSTLDLAATPEANIESGTGEESNAAAGIESAPVKAPPKSWAELFARGPIANGVASPTKSTGQATDGTPGSRTSTFGDMLYSYTANNNESKLSFLEPRGLVNTGNMCYMNAVLQVLVFCVPFYELLDQIGKRIAHSFKSETPLIEAMIMFMREFPIIDSAMTIEQLRLRLKDTELEQYGEAFIPEYVYEVIKRLPRFATMRRGHQQDAEEFLGFLLEGLHDECTHIIKANKNESLQSDTLDGSMPSTSDAAAVRSNSADSGWLEVGPKQKASVTRSSGIIATESPITKIFGGKLRSVLRVPGLKDSVTLESYQPLQLDIGAPNVSNITDALKGLTRSETLHGEFKSPRGPGTTATKQVFIETLPSVLILHLKRFQYDNTGGTQKIWRKIGYPLDLEIPKEVFPQAQRANLTLRPGGLPKYRLISVVYHHGKSASGGHYTVDVRRQDGREWIRLDDTIIRRIRAEDVASEGAEEDPKILAKALEQHKRDIEANISSNIYKEAFGGDDQQIDDDQQGGWSQVPSSITSPTIAAAKKWSNVANGATITSASSTTTPGRQTPKASSKSSIKDNKVAYILFYQRIGQ